MERPESPVAPLLVLAALDMLSSALVCGVVLFVVLVGGQSDARSASNSVTGLSAPTILEVFAAKQEQPVIGETEWHGPPGAEEQEPFSSDFFRSPFTVTAYGLNPGQHEFIIDEMSGPAIILIHAGNGATTALYLRCSRLSEPMTVETEPDVLTQGSCGAVQSDAQPVMLQKTVDESHVRITALIGPNTDITQLPQQWSQTSGGTVAIFGASEEVRYSAPLATEVPAGISIFGVL